MKRPTPEEMNNNFNLRQLYKEHCQCGEAIEVYTQADCEPEYYTDIFVVCKKCDHLIKFELPVN